jgi:hypothetical protein
LGVFPGPDPDGSDLDRATKMWKFKIQSGYRAALSVAVADPALLRMVADPGFSLRPALLDDSRRLPLLDSVRSLFGGVTR